MPLLSKSKFLIGLQCPVWLWKEVNAKEELPKIDAATQAKFDIGHQVGELAQRLFPTGVRMVTENFSANLDQTKQWLPKKKPLFEPGFMVDNLFARPDVLVPAPSSSWDVVEVKSSTGVKPEHYYDLAFQKHVYEKSGLKIRNTSILHLNSDYIKRGAINPEQLFTLVDVTEDVEKIFPEIPGLVEEQWRIINRKACPETRLTGQCEPYHACPVHESLFEALPEGNVFELYCGGAKAVSLYESGIKTLASIPPSESINDKQRVQAETARTGEAHVDQEKLKKWLSKLSYPLYYLDFETEMFAIPVHDGTWPYQQVPVQFSLHIQRANGDVEHHEYLHEGTGDPRPGFAKTLEQALAGTGTIIVYHQSFEEGRLRELAYAYPEHKEWVEDAIKRMQDLIIPFRQFWYHSPAQRGSCSLKSTMPALLGKDHYAKLGIHDGGTAQSEYMRITYEEVPEAEKQRVRKDLLKYCCLDTEGMVWMIDELRKIS